MVRVVIGYCALVVLPVAALFGVLESGRALKAPPNLDGMWKWKGPASGLRFAANVEPAVRVTQSGMFLTFGFNDIQQTMLAGEVQDGQVFAGKAGFTLRGSITPDRMVGAAGSSPSGTLPFHAERIGN